MTPLPIDSIIGDAVLWVPLIAALLQALKKIFPGLEGRIVAFMAFLSGPIATFTWWMANSPERDPAEAYLAVITGLVASLGAMGFYKGIDGVLNRAPRAAETAARRESEP